MSISPDSASTPPPLASPAPERASASAAALPIKKSKLPVIITGVFISLVLFLAILGGGVWMQKSRARAGRNVVVNEQAPAARSTTDDDGYGVTLPKPEPKKEPSKANPEAVGPNALGVASMVKAAKKAKDTAKEMISKGEMAAPEVREGSAAAAAKGGQDDGKSDYGDEGDGYSKSERLTLPAGRPRIPPKDKDSKPEQYYADVSPWPKLTKAGPPPPAKPQIPAREVVLGGANASAQSAPEVFAPGGRIVPCELVFAIDSAAGNSGCMIVATTTSDLIFEDRVIIPKGSEVLGRVGQAIFESTTQGRVFDVGQWRIIMPRQPGKPAGRELRVTATAHLAKPLVTEDDGRVRQWDQELDGRPGLPGRIVSLRDAAKWKRLGMDVLGSVAKDAINTMKDERPSGGLMGGYEATPTVKNIGVGAMSNAVSGAAGSMSQNYAKQEQLAEYVAVSGGTKFYLFIESTLLPAEATTGSQSVSKWGEGAADNRNPPLPALNP